MAGKTKKAKKVRGELASDPFHDWAAGVIEQGASDVQPFEVNGYHVGRSWLVKVAQEIRARHIGVYLIGTKSDFDAGYVSESETDFGGCILIERHGSTQMIMYKSRLIHEAVHAAFDVKGGSSPFTMSAYVDEACAFIAQAMYLRRNGVLPADVVGHACLSAAWHCASSLIGGTAVSGASLRQLEQALEKYNYKNTRRVKNGV